MQLASRSIEEEKIFLFPSPPTLARSTDSKNLELSFWLE
jgi:hypothetical protein